MSEELEPTEVDNSQSQEPDPQGQSDTEDKFGGDYDKAVQSYKELEKKLGENSSDMKSIRDEMVTLRASAKAADDATQALSARDNISKADALERLNKESNKILQEHAPAVAQKKTTDAISQLETKIQEMELLRTYPESSDHMDLIRDLAASTGKPMREVFEKRVMNLVEKDNTPAKKAQSYNPSFRHVDDTSPASSRERKKLYEIAQNAFQTGNKKVRDQAVHEIIKGRLKDQNLI